jgi:hypothetical protein
MWKTSDRRRFLNKFAKANSFDPLVAENWYSVSAAIVKGVKVVISIVAVISIC